MKHLPLVCGTKFAIVDDVDYPYLSQFKWHKLGNYVARTLSDGKQMLLQKEVLPSSDPRTRIYFKNKNPLDCRLENLEARTPTST